MLKTQVMTMMMMKSSQQHQAKPGAAANSTSSDIYTIVYSMLVMSFMEWIFKHLPAVALFFKTLIELKLKPKKDAWLPKLPTSLNPKEVINSITMLRTFQKTDKGDRADNPCVEKIDAVLDYICSLDNARHLKMDVRYMLNNDEEIELTPLLKSKVTQKLAGDDAITEISIYSSMLKVGEIRAWIDDVHSNYVAEKNNKLGNKIYFFNEIPQEPVIVADMRAVHSGENSPPPQTNYKWDALPKNLTFAMNEFKTSKSFSNVYGTHVEELKERLDLFIQHPEWYMDRGIPHSLGILLHGIPGGGKTSTIKAVAKDTNRHIFNLMLRSYTTQRQLMNLFYNENVVVHTNDGTKVTLKIPLNRRVYVIEDIDCLTDVVLDRKRTSDAGTQSTPTEGITLSFLLNLLDGVLETPGRILIMTSNYPEKLDRALVRPGRIDVKIEFSYASREFILEMLNKFYEESYSLDEIPAELDSVFTPAEVMESMCAHFKSPEKALLHLIKKAKGTPILLEDQAATAVQTSELVEEKPEELVVEATKEAAPQLVINEIKEMDLINTNSVAIPAGKLTKRNIFSTGVGGKALDPIKDTWFCDCVGDGSDCATCKSYVDKQTEQNWKLNSATIEKFQSMTDAALPPAQFEKEDGEELLQRPPSPKNWGSMFDIPTDLPKEVPEFDVMTKFNEMMEARR
jgi:ATP-dependent 26S proteasome regulatory subunit